MTFLCDMTERGRDVTRRDVTRHDVTDIWTDSIILDNSENHRRLKAQDENRFLELPLAIPGS